MRILDPSHPFYRPAWRRWLIVAAAFGWAFLEYGQGNAIWAYLFAAIGGWLAWNLILRWTPDDAP
jgi:hypothetical protein